MFYRNMFEYLESKQNPNDIYFRYRKHKENLSLQFKAQTAGEYLYNEAAAALKEEILKTLNQK